MGALGPDNLSVAQEPAHVIFMIFVAEDVCPEDKTNLHASGELTTTIFLPRMYGGGEELSIPAIMVHKTMLAKSLMLVDTASLGFKKPRSQEASPPMSYFFSIVLYIHQAV